MTCEILDLMTPNHSSPVQQGVAADAQQLLIRAGQGDSDAFGLFYDQSCAQIFGMVQALLGTTHSSEQVLEKIFVDAWSQAPRFSSGNLSALAWLANIAHQRCLWHLRESLGLQQPGAKAARPPTTEGQRRFTENPALSQAFGKLSDMQQQALHLTYFAGLGDTEVAAQLQLPVETVKSQLLDALRKLRDLMGVA